MAVVQNNPQFSIAADYEVAGGGVEPLWGSRNDLPTLTQIEDGIAATPNLEKFFIDRASSANDTLLISRAVGGSRGVGIVATILAFDPQAHERGFVWSELYGNADGSSNPYDGGDSGVIHDNHQNTDGNFTDLGTMWDVAFLLGDKTDPATGNSAYTEGLVYTDKEVAAQRAALKAERARAAKLGITIVSSTLGHIVADASVQRTSGNPQRAGVTRLIHYPNKRVGFFGHVPYVARGGDRLDFYGSGVHNPFHNLGARRLVRVTVPSLEA